MTVKEAYMLLGRPLTLQRELARLQGRRNELWLSCLPGAIRYDIDRVKSSPADKMPDLFAEIDQIDRDIEWLGRQRNMVYSALYRRIVNDMPYCREIIVLQQYFLAGHSMNYIAKHLGVTYQHCFRIRKNAVELFAELATKDGWDYKGDKE